jgi:uncharacterized protein YndB with AHSA1/START domain
LKNSSATASARCATSRKNWKAITMTKPSFVYVTYIATTPEKVWQALVDTDVTRQYWVGGNGPAHVNVSDWKPGSRWEHQRVDETHAVDIVGKVVETDPPRHLVLTWSRTNRNIRALRSISSHRAMGSFV